MVVCVHRRPAACHTSIPAISGNRPPFLWEENQPKTFEYMPESLTMEHKNTPKANISSPASRLRSFLILKTSINRFDIVRAMPAGSCLSEDGEMIGCLEYCTVVVLRWLHVLKNLPMIFVGGLSSVLGDKCIYLSNSAKVIS